jgi:hypothetical protein
MHLRLWGGALVTEARPGSWELEGTLPRLLCATTQMLHELANARSTIEDSHD